MNTNRQPLLQEDRQASISHHDSAMLGNPAAAVARPRLPVGCGRPPPSFDDSDHEGIPLQAAKDANALRLRKPHVNHAVNDDGNSMSRSEVMHEEEIDDEAEEARYWQGVDHIKEKTTTALNLTIWKYMVIPQLLFLFPLILTAHMSISSDSKLPTAVELASPSSVSEIPVVIQVVPVSIAILAFLYKITFVCCMRKNGIVYKDLLKGILVPGDIPDWIIVIIADVLFLFAVVLGVLPTFYSGNPCVREGYSIPNDPGASFMTTNLALFVKTCHPTQEMIDSNNATFFQESLYPMADQFFWSRVAIWMAMAIQVVLGVVVPFEFTKYADYRRKQAKRTLISELRDHLQDSQTFTDDQAIIEEEDLDKIDHLAEIRTDVQRKSFAPYAAGAFVGLVASLLVWPDQAFFYLLSQDILETTGTFNMVTIQNERHKQQLLVMFHIMDGSYPIIVNCLASIWFFILGFSFAAVFVILALRFTQNKVVLVTLREMTNAKKATEWQLPFLNLKTLHGIRSFVNLRKLYLQNEFEDEYQLFSIIVGVTGFFAIWFSTILVLVFSLFTPKVITQAGTFAIIAFNYLWVATCVLLCGLSMLLLASAAGIYQEQISHKDLLKQTIRQLAFLNEAEPNPKLLESLKAAQEELEEEKEAPHACGIPIKPDAFRILVGYASMAGITVVYRLISAQFV